MRVILLTIFFSILKANSAIFPGVPEPGMILSGDVYDQRLNSSAPISFSLKFFDKVNGNQLSSMIINHDNGKFHANLPFESSFQIPSQNDIFVDNALIPNVGNTHPITITASSADERSKFYFLDDSNRVIGTEITLSNERLPRILPLYIKLVSNVKPSSDQTNPALYPTDATGIPKAQVKVPFLVNNFQGISGIQTTITWDESVMQLVLDGDNPKVTDSPEIMPNFPIILPNHFSIHSSNQLTMVWDESIDPENGRSLEDESVLFALHFTLVGNAGESGVIRLSDDPTPFKLAPGSGEDIVESTQWANVTLIKEFTVSGNVTMGAANNLPVSGVTVTLNQDGSESHTMSDVNGKYSFNLASGAGIELTAGRAHGEGKASTGVDVADIVAMRKHILARVRFENAREMLSADTNRDASVDVADIVAMRKVILARTDYFSEDSGGNKESCWRFVDGDYLSVEVDNAFSELPKYESIIFSSLESDVSGADFTGIKLGDVNGDWYDANSTTLFSRNTMNSRGLLSLSAARVSYDGTVSVDLNANTSEELLGMQFKLNWDGQVLRLKGIEDHQLRSYSQQIHSHRQDGSVQVAWDDALLSGVDVAGNKAVMTVHFTQQPEADRGTNIQLTHPLLVGPEGSQKATMGLASYYHPKGGLILSSRGLIRSLHRSEDGLSIEFETRNGMSYVVERAYDLSSGQWEAITTIKGSGRQEVFDIPKTKQAEAYLRVREVNGAVE